MNHLSHFTRAMAILVLAASHALAVPVTQTARYDGTYNPYGVAPAGQTTWTNLGGTLSPTPNATTGLANFTDGTAAERMTVATVFTDAQLISSPATTEWEYQIDLLVTSPGSAPATLLGVRDEGGNGKSALFALTLGSSNVTYMDNTGAVSGANVYNGGVDGPSLLNGTVHSYRVVKRAVAGVMTVEFFIDGVQQDSRAYSSLPDDQSAANGFGFYSGTSSTSNFQVDEMRFGAVALKHTPLDISASFNADTLASSGSDSSGTGFRGALNEKFIISPALTDGFTLQLGGGANMQLGPIAGDNTILMGVNSSTSVDIADNRYSQISVLSSAVGLNVTTDGALTIFYTDGSNSGPIAWDAPDNGNLTSVDSLVALSGLTLQRMQNAQAFGSRQMFYQMFNVDPSRVVDRLVFSTVGISDPGNDAQWGIFAISGLIVIPEPATMLLLLCGGPMLLRRRRN